MLPGESCRAISLTIGDWNLRADALPRHLLLMLDDLVDSWESSDLAGYDRESVLEALIVKQWLDDGGNLGDVYAGDGVPKINAMRRS